MIPKEMIEVNIIIQTIIIAEIDEWDIPEKKILAIEIPAIPPNIEYSLIFWCFTFLILEASNTPSRINLKFIKKYMLIMIKGINTVNSVNGKPYL